MDDSYPMDAATEEPMSDTTDLPDSGEDLPDSGESSNVVALPKTYTQCTATNRQGNRCGRAPIPGGAVCSMHGGKAPQVREAAATRLAQARDIALERLIEYIADDGDIADPKVLLDTVVRLSDKVELLQGRATARTEVDERVHYEQVKVELMAKLDDLAARNYRGIVRPDEDTPTALPGEGDREIIDIEPIDIEPIDIEPSPEGADSGASPEGASQDPPSQEAPI